jgi:glycosyltransferase involved in cell wall biosynthesis
MRVVRTINGLNWVYSSRSPLALAARPVYRTLHRLAARMTTATIFQNSDDRTFFEQHRMVEREKSLLIPGAGVDIEGLRKARARVPSPEEIREELGLIGSEVVLTVARMTRQKGIPTLLDAAALVHAVRPDVRFVLVGPRESEGRLAITQVEIDRHAPYVIALGQRSDVPALLRIADVFAFPTEYREGIPRALLEAAATGVPIVATQMPGCWDVVRDGWNGFLVPPRAPIHLAEKILQSLRDRESARVMAARAMELMAQKFSLDVVVARHDALYSNIRGIGIAVQALASEPLAGQP